MTPSQSKMRAWRVDEAETDSALGVRVALALALALALPLTLLLLPLPREKESGVEEIRAEEKFRGT